MEDKEPRLFSRQTGTVFLGWADPQPKTRMSDVQNFLCGRLWWNDCIPVGTEYVQCLWLLGTFKISQLLSVYLIVCCPASSDITWDDAWHSVLLNQRRSQSFFFFKPHLSRIITAIFSAVSLGTKACYIFKAMFILGPRIKMENNFCP